MPSHTQFPEAGFPLRTITQGQEQSWAQVTASVRCNGEQWEAPSLAFSYTHACPHSPDLTLTTQDTHDSVQTPYRTIVLGGSFQLSSVGLSGVSRSLGDYWRTEREALKTLPSSPPLPIHPLQPDLSVISSVRLPCKILFK